MANLSYKSTEINRKYTVKWKILHQFLPLLPLSGKLFRSLYPAAEFNKNNRILTISTILSSPKHGWDEPKGSHAYKESKHSHYIIFTSLGIQPKQIM